MNNKNIYFFFIISLIFISCKDKQTQIKELEFYDSIIAENTRLKGYLIKNAPYNINELENFLYDYSKNILSDDFITQSINMIIERNPTTEEKAIEIDFFRVSKELPWIMNKDYIPPYHLGEGNPVDWIGRFIYNVNSDEIKYYFVCKRKKSFLNYGKITEEIEYKKYRIYSMNTLQKYPWSKKRLYQ